jgi:hypothetical protein
MLDPSTVRVGCAVVLIVAGASSCGDGAMPERTTAPAVESTVPAVETTSQAPRNPFGLEDVRDCCGPEVVAFAEARAPSGGPDDENAAAWAGTDPGAEYASIDGEWASRWKFEGEQWVAGTATVRSVDDRVFILYRDNLEYLAEARRIGDRLVGRYTTEEHAMDTSPFVLTIVSNERMDGVYLSGRWDFRRPGQAPGTGTE